MIANIRSGCFLICTRCLVHSLAVVEAIVLLVAVDKVAVLEVVAVKVHLITKVKVSTLE